MARYAIWGLGLVGSNISSGLGWFLFEAVRFQQFRGGHSCDDGQKRQQSQPKPRSRTLTVLGAVGTSHGRVDRRFVPSTGSAPATVHRFARRSASTRQPKTPRTPNLDDFCGNRNRGQRCLKADRLTTTTPTRCCHSATSHRPENATKRKLAPRNFLPRISYY